MLKSNTIPALIVIDVQEGFDDAAWGPRNNPAAENQIAALLRIWRSRSLPVFHIQHESTSLDGSFRPGTPGHRHKSQVAPLDGEPIYHKTVNSAFIGTNLEADLRARSINDVILVGLTTNHCVSTTARMAGNLGFRTVVVSDATAAFDRPMIDGRMRCAQDVHDAALSDLSNEFALILTTAEVVNNLQAADQDISVH